MPFPSELITQLRENAPSITELSFGEQHVDWLHWNIDTLAELVEKNTMVTSISLPETIFYNLLKALNKKTKLEPSYIKLSRLLLPSLTKDKKTKLQEKLISIKEVMVTTFDIFLDYLECSTQENILEQYNWTSLMHRHNGISRFVQTNQAKDKIQTFIIAHHDLIVAQIIQSTSVEEVSAIKKRLTKYLEQFQDVTRKLDEVFAKKIEEEHKKTDRNIDQLFYCIMFIHLPYVLNQNIIFDIFEKKIENCSSLTDLMSINTGLCCASFLFKEICRRKLYMYIDPEPDPVSTYLFSIIEKKAIALLQQTKYDENYPKQLQLIKHLLKSVPMTHHICSDHGKAPNPSKTWWEFLFALSFMDDILHKIKSKLNEDTYAIIVEQMDKWFDKQIDNFITTNPIFCKEEMSIWLENKTVDNFMKTFPISNQSVEALIPLSPLSKYNHEIFLLYAIRKENTSLFVALLIDSYRNELGDEYSWQIKQSNHMLSKQHIALWHDITLLTYALSFCKTNTTIPRLILFTLLQHNYLEIIRITALQSHHLTFSQILTGLDLLLQASDWFKNGTIQDAIKIMLQNILQQINSCESLCTSEKLKIEMMEHPVWKKLDKIKSFSQKSSIQAELLDVFNKAFYSLLQSENPFNFWDTYVTQPESNFDCAKRYLGYI